MATLRIRVKGERRKECNIGMRHVGITVVLALTLNASAGFDGLNLSLGTLATLSKARSCCVAPENPNSVTVLESRENFRIRDPFVLVDGGKYWLYETKPWNGGMGVEVRVSDDVFYGCCDG